MARAARVPRMMSSGRRRGAGSAASDARQLRGGGSTAQSIISCLDHHHCLASPSLGKPEFFLSSSSRAPPAHRHGLPQLGLSAFGRGFTQFAPTLASKA